MLRLGTTAEVLKNDRAKILWDILVRDKVEKKAVVIWKKEQEKPGSETAAKEDMGIEKNSSPRGHRGTLGCDSRAGGVAPADPRNI